jgi:hypothetical protein
MAATNFPASKAWPDRSSEEMGRMCSHMGRRAPGF